jgi:hypothetical protein
MKTQYLALVISTAIFSSPAFASRGECEPQRPNVHIFGSPAPARLIFGSAIPAAVPTHHTYFRPARASVANPLYTPYGGINCERTAVFAGNIEGVTFASIGYYQYGPFASGSNGINLELSIAARNDSLRQNSAIKFAELSFNTQDNLSLYMKYVVGPNQKTPQLLICAQLIDPIADIPDTAVNCENARIATLPVLSDGVNQDIDVEIRWANGLVISAFDYSTWDPIWNVSIRKQVSAVKNTLRGSIQSINYLRIGSIADTNAFNDRVQFQEVFSINSVQWLQ